jgi:xanthine dehydrogenase molybdopterin-binding subunit B
MPVLIVSEKTWPQDGFSRKRSILPSSSVTTIPNSSGFSTDLSPIVTARRLLAMEVDERLQVDVAEASPEMTTNVSSSFRSRGGRAGRAERRLLDRVLDVDARATRRRRSSCGSPAAGTRP